MKQQTRRETQTRGRACLQIGSGPVPGQYLGSEVYVGEFSEVRGVMEGLEGVLVTIRAAGTRTRMAAL